MQKLSLPIDIPPNISPPRVHKNSVSLGLSSKHNFTKDVAIILNVIDHHADRLGIQSMFEKGPPIDRYFIWNNDDGYWTQNEFTSLIEIGKIVLSYDYKHDGYYVMMKTIQKELKRRSSDLQRRSLDTISNEKSSLEKELLNHQWIAIDLKHLKITNDV